MKDGDQQPIKLVKGLDLGELKTEVTPSDITAAAKTAGKNGFDFAVLKVGETKCLIAAIHPQSSAAKALIRALGLVNEPRLATRPELIRLSQPDRANPALIGVSTK